MSGTSTMSYNSLSDVVLYDVFFETATQLTGRLVALQRAAEAAGDTITAEQWRARSHAVADERDAVDARDREAQVSALTAWDRERSALPRP